MAAKKQGGRPKNAAAKSKPAKRSAVAKVKAAKQAAPKDEEAQQDRGPLAGIGHNSTKGKPIIQKAKTAIDALQEKLATYRGEVMNDIKAIYADAANDLGCKRSLVRMAIAAAQAQDKLDAKLEELEPEDRSKAESMLDWVGYYGDLVDMAQNPVYAKKDNGAKKAEAPPQPAPAADPEPVPEQPSLTEDEPPEHVTTH